MKQVSPEVATVTLVLTQANDGSLSDKGAYSVSWTACINKERYVEALLASRGKWYILRPTVR